MRLLFDLISTHHFIGGGAEYVRKVLYSLIETKAFVEGSVQIIGLVDTNVGHFAYDDLAPDNLKRMGIEIADIALSSLKKIQEEKKVDKFFMGCAQLLRSYDIEDITCPVISVVHDMCTEEYETNHMEDYVRLNNLKKFLRYKFHVFRHGNRALEEDKKIFKMLQNNTNSQLITVSDYSKYSINFNYGYPLDKISVLYSPERVMRRDNSIYDETLKSLISSKRKYYLMLSANRLMKNADKAIRAFHRFAEEKGKDCYFVTIGYKEKRFNNHIVIDYLSETDLANAIANCYALVFPSFFEGFGYPPIEAMSYRKPVLCSNVTSIREVVGDAAIYFSPFYESDIFKALMTLNDDNYGHYVNKARCNYLKVHERQNNDLQVLINRILTNEK